MIQLRGVRVHNLQNIDVDIPQGGLVAVCGVSGSGKTSLAIDTLYAEGQRRYIESFSAYTRQFLERLDKPDYDRIDGLTPALAVTRSTAPRGNRSTVGTASESLDFLRLLFAKVSQLVCYGCGRRIQPASPQSVATCIGQLSPASRVMISYLVHWESTAERASVLADLQQQGMLRLICSNQLVNLSDIPRNQLAKLLPRSGNVWVVVDRLRGGEIAARSVDSLETAFSLGLGEIRLFIQAEDSYRQQVRQLRAGKKAASAVEPPLQEILDNWGVGAKHELQVIDSANWLPVDFTNRWACPKCQIEYPPPSSRLFSFNSPLGACPQCEGFGDTNDFDMQLIVPNPQLSIREGAIATWNNPTSQAWYNELIERAAELGIPLDAPFAEMSSKQVSILRFGDPAKGYEGLAGYFAYLERKKYKMHIRVFLSRWRSYSRCSRCQGQRLKPESLSYQIAGMNIAQWCCLAVEQLGKLITERLVLDTRQLEIASLPLQQLRNRLAYLQEVGLGYLTLDRTLRTLSGGEGQRTALAAALGSDLVNMLYVLDEPSVGLHPHDVENLSKAIVRLSQRGNTVVMIEHEESLLKKADWIIEMGPGAGSAGGKVVYSGPHNELQQAKTLTGSYLSGQRTIPLPAMPRTPTAWLTLTGCSGNNLKNIDVRFPLGVLCLVTGVSGSGKSSLVQDTLYGAIANRLTSQRHETLPYQSLLGLSNLDECLMIDQSPLNRTVRSNPVTIIKAFDEIRSVFAASSDARIRGFSPGHFSFNSELGRCPRCEGNGVLQIDMQFLADVFMTCPDCHGSRYRLEILQVRYRDHSIADVLRLSVRDAIHFFRGQPKVQSRLSLLANVGLDYLELGQPATTLSSGESQRLKLASHLATAKKQRTLFILDEPTTGLHTHDCVQLLDCLDALLAAGHSLVIVEHNLQLMSVADHIIDLGPGPAQQGGQVVATGTPVEVSKCEYSATGRHLREMLSKNSTEKP